MSLAALIARRRNELGISQEQLAERTGIRQSYLSQMERGAVKTTRKYIDALARGLEVSVDDVKVAMGFVVATDNDSPEKTDQPLDAAAFLRLLAENPNIDVAGMGMADITPEERQSAIKNLWNNLPAKERSALLRELLEEE